MGFLSVKLRIQLENALYEVNSNIEKVNSGGCGFFAKHLHNALVEKGFNPELVILVADYAVDTANFHVTNNNIKDLFKTNWYHVMVKLNKPNGKPYYIDSYGFFTNLSIHPTFDYCVPVELPYDMLTKMLSSRYKGRWNTRFNRKNSKKIKKILSKNLDI
jgi:hypothetical protein